MKEKELIILGSGPGGLSAACEAAKAGVSITLLDENPNPGGQIYRQLNSKFSITEPKVLGKDYQRGQKLLAEFKSIQNQVEYMGETLVWGIFPDNELAFLKDGKSHNVRFRKLIVSAGAYERPVPFPGWTLPGVFTAGGAQQLVKTQRVLPGEKILLVGTGPLQLSLAYQIIDVGGNVVGIAEAGDAGNWFRLAGAFWNQWKLLGDACRYLYTIRKAGVPLWRNHIIVEVHGDNQVEEAIVAEVDQNWRPKRATYRTLSVDTVCAGYGFVPSTELTRLAQCRHQYDPNLGGWTPLRDENMETDVPGIYAAGDCTGIAGSVVSVEEGHIAGIAVARALGYITPGEAEKRMKSIRKRLKGIKRFRRIMDEISLPRPGLYELHGMTLLFVVVRRSHLGRLKML